MARKIVLGMGIIVLFALIMLSLSLYLTYGHDEREKTRLTPGAIDDMSKEEIKDFITERRKAEPSFHSFYLLPLFAFIGLLVGLIVYYIMSDKVVHQEKKLKKNTMIILNFLTSEEKTVVKTLMENRGRVPQYELSHLPSLNKLKTHRILANLENKGIIKKLKIGKINKIVLNKELYEVLK